MKKLLILLVISIAPLPFFGQQAFTDYFHIISYGQSNSREGGFTPAISPHKYNTLMPYQGIRIGTGGIYSPLVPLIEQIHETIVSGSLHAYFENKPFIPANIKIVGTAAGFGGSPLHQLVKGTSSYTRLLDHVQQVYNICKTENKSYSVPFIAWVQGETDQDMGVNYREYDSTMSKFMLDVNNDIKNITMQENDILFISPQLSYGLYHGKYRDWYRIPKFHYDESIDSTSHLVIACPSYMFDYLSSDGVHLSSESKRKLGAYIGLAGSHEKKFIPMHPTNVLINGHSITIKFIAPSYPIVLDNNFPNAGNYGFKVVRDTSNLADTIRITSVKTIDINKIQINVSENPLGSTIFYAANPNPADNYVNKDGLTIKLANRGNLHDSQNTLFDGSPMYNWCLSFGITLDSTALPVILKEFNAVTSTSNVSLNWSIYNENVADQFILERSYDGNAFMPVDTIKANNSYTYSMIDYPKNQSTYYRLKVMAVNENVSYSDKVKVDFNQTRINIASNPIKGVIHINLSESYKGGLLYIIDNSGRVVFRSTAKTQDINTHFWPKGIYYLQVITKEKVLKEKLLKLD